MFVKSGRIIPTFYTVFLFVTLFCYVRPVEGAQKYHLYSSDEKKFVWFRVYKVASTTTKEILVKSVPDLIMSRPKDCPQEYADYFKFSFVRNPWDRVVSCYFNKVVTKRIPEFQDCFDKDFEFFVDFLNSQDLTEANAHIKLQSKLIPVKQLDFIGKLDNFADDLKYVCSIIGIECDVIPHENKTDHAHYSSYYTPRTQQIVAEKYRDDIKAFGFTFETK